MLQNPESTRLKETRNAKAQWKKWGPYLSERQWGTVREDYSQGGNAWDYFSHDQARSRAYPGGKTVLPASATTSSRSASVWPCGMAVIQSSRNASSV